jgi:hypothetical protein
MTGTFAAASIWLMRSIGKCLSPCFRGTRNYTGEQGPINSSGAGKGVRLDWVGGPPEDHRTLGRAGHYSDRQPEVNY